MNNSPVKSELYVALEMVELTQFLPFTLFLKKTQRKLGFLLQQSNNDNNKKNATEVAFHLRMMS